MDVRLSQSVRIAEAVMASLEAAGITRDDPDYITLVEAECDIYERLRRMFRVSRLTKAEADAARGIAKEIQDRADRMSAKAASLDAMILQALSELGERKLEAPDFKLSVVPGPVSVKGNADPETLPERFVRIKKEIRKTAIKEALEAGEVVEGFSLANGAPYLKVTK